MSDAILITGASRGIGRAIRERLIADGDTVVNLDAGTPDPGAPGVHYAFDPGDPAAQRDVLSEICARYTITALVNNAAPATRHALEHTGAAELDATLCNSVEAALTCVNAVLPGMRVRGNGRIVNIASALVTGPEGHTLDAVTRGALVSMTRTWALEFKHLAITVNAIAPGHIEAEPRASTCGSHGPPHAGTRTSTDIHTGRPQDVAHAAAFFLDPRSAFITGQLLFVCDGLSIGGPNEP